MKTNIIQVGFAPFEAFRARTMAIARGELCPAADDPKVWFPSIESLGRVLSAKSRDLLATICETPPI